MVSKGAARLKRLFSPPMGTQAEFARRLGVSPQAVNNWLTGRDLPGVENLVEIEKATGIKVAEWLESEGGDSTEEATP